MTLNRKNAHRAAEDRRAMYRSRNGALLLAARRIAPAAARRAARGTLAGTLLSRGASVASAGRAGIALAGGALAIAGATLSRLPPAPTVVELRLRTLVRVEA